MAKNNDAWRALVTQIPKTRKLSHEWLNHKPEVEGFELEDYNLNVLYKQRKKFEDNKELRSQEMRKSIPKPTRGQFSWEGYVALIFMMGMVGYQFLVDTPSWYMFGFLAIGSMFFFFLYYYRLRKKQVLLKKKIEQINQEQKKIDAEVYEHEDAYSQLVRYARAVRDYEAWERRKNPNSWKKYTEKQLVSEFISM